MAARLVLIQEAAGSTPAAPSVAVADMAMHRIVAPDHAGSTPASHPAPWCNGSTQGFDPCGAGSSPAGAVSLSFVLPLCLNEWGTWLCEFHSVIDKLLRLMYSGFEEVTGCCVEYTFCNGFYDVSDVGQDKN